MLLEANEEFDEEGIMKKAIENGIRVYPLSPYCLKSKRKGLVLGFSKVDEETIEYGINRLSELVRS